MGGRSSVRGDWAASGYELRCIADVSSSIVDTEFVKSYD